MALLFNIMLMFAICVLMYQSFILPSIRRNIRYDFYAQRDRLRKLRHDHQDELGEETYAYTQDMLNFCVNVLHEIDVWELVRLVSLVKSDNNFQERMNARKAVLDSCRLPEFVEIREETERLFKKIAFFNSMMVLVLIYPLIQACRIAGNLRTILVIPPIEYESKFEGELKHA